MTTGWRCEECDYMFALSIPLNGHCQGCNRKMSDDELRLIGAKIGKDK